MNSLQEQEARLKNAGICSVKWQDISKPDAKGEVKVSLDKCFNCSEKTFCLKLVSAFEKELNMRLRTQRTLDAQVGIKARELEGV